MSRRPLIWLAINLFIATGLVHAIEPDFLMDSDPALRLPDPIKKFNSRRKVLWIEALQRPEIDMQRMAAETIARAHQHGIPDLIEAVPTLEKILLAESSHPAARFAAARALIVLESHGSSEKLLKASQEFGDDLKQLVEPAMAEWDVVSARSIWSKRLETPGTRPRDLLLAIRGLGEVREQSALPTLLKMVLDLVNVSDVRLASATAAGRLVDSGLEQDADRLAQETRTSQIANRTCAIFMLGRHESDVARQLLIRLADDAEPSVAAAALSRLNDIDPGLVVPLAESAMKNADQHVREQGVSAYLSLPTVERIKPLSQLLADSHPKVRKQVCDGLYRLAQNPELNEAIRTDAMEVLNSDRWQGQEQAVLLLGMLEHKPASQRLVELLESPRAEVMVASAWALRKVAVPETAAAIVDKAVRQTLARKTPSDGLTAIDRQVAHLFETCGELKTTEAVPLLVKYIPLVPDMGERSRSAAIRTLGLLNVGVPDQALCDALMKRAEDYKSRPAESALVKQQCLIAVARMKAVDRAPDIRKELEHGIGYTRLDMARRWAMKELTGEEFPEPVAPKVDQGTWFLEPLKD